MHRLHRHDERQLGDILFRVAGFGITLVAFVLIYKGGNEAHILSGLKLNLNWDESSPEAKLIFGFGSLIVGLGLNIAWRVIRLNWRIRDSLGD